MLTEDHIFTIKTKDQQNVTDIQNGSAGVVISGLNVLKDKIKVGDLVFVVFGGDNPPWEPGFVGLAIVSQAPFDEGYDGGRNFRVKIDIKTYFTPIKRSDLVTYPATFGIIGIAPVVKWEPNQALTNVPKDKAIALLQATWEMRPSARHDIENLLGSDFSQISGSVKRFTEMVSPLGGLDLRPEFIKWAPHKKPTKAGKTASEDTIKKYVGYLNCLNKPMSNTGNASGSGWDGVVEFITGHRPEKSYYGVERLDEFDSMFGVLGKALSGEPAPGGVILAHYNQVATWANAPSIKKHMCLLAAYVAYREFLQWREDEQKKNDEPKLNVTDILTVALKMFADKRKEDGEGGWKKEGWSVNGRIRKYFESLTTAQIQTWGEAEVEDLFLGPIDGTTGKHKKNEAVMWSGQNGSGWNCIKPGTAQEVQDVKDALVLYKDSPNNAADFCKGTFKGPKGFGPSVVSELLMKFHPDAWFKHGSVTNEVLTNLGLIDFPHKSNYSDGEYKQVCGVAAKLLARMVSMKLPRQINEDGSEETAKPDYLTVNEFIWFVNDKDNFKDIKNEVVKMAMTPAKHTPYDKTKGKKKTFESTAEDQLMLRILASLRTKPFVILAGHSGTGKSRMVKKLAYMTCRDNALHEGSDPGNYCMIEVKPNWHDSTELLGYFSSFGSDHYVKKQLIDFIMKAYAYPNVPFFVCLDEMNLAPVEQYFAEFLSALEDIHEDTDKMTAFLALDAAYKPESPSAAEEVIKYSSAELVKAIDYKDDPMLLEPKYPISRDWVKTHGLTIPKNLFVVGTVNMDESTNQFSRKVLDRAFTIEMTDACFEDFGDSTKDPTPTFVTETDTDHDLIDALLTGKKQSDKPLTKKVNPADPNGQLENMNALKEILAGTPFVVAYRFANEYALYEQALNKLDEKDAAGNPKPAENAKRAFDEVVLMKLLPRIAGEAKAVKAIYEGEKKGDGSIKKSGLLQLLPYDKDDATKQTQSGKKMREILGRGDLPYLTFWP